MLTSPYSSSPSRSKEEFSKETYFSNVHRVKSLQKSFEYPVNPSYQNANSRN